MYARTRGSEWHTKCNSMYIRLMRSDNVWAGLSPVYGGFMYIFVFGKILTCARAQNWLIW